jgi:hypothetical protein
MASPLFSKGVVMVGRRIALSGIGAFFVAAGTATAAGEPEVFASSRIGSLSVTTGVLVAPKSVDMRGVWVDETQPCSQTRLLDVRAQVDYIPFGGQGQRFERKRTFRTANCAEGGPNMGFTFTPKAIGFGCPSGAWKPGRYHFTTVALDRRKRLRSVASVGWEKREPC